MSRAFGFDGAGLEARWRRLLPAGAGRRGDEVLAEIVRAYGAEGRHYHDLAHVAALLALAEAEAALIEDRRAVDLAIFFHDAVYDARTPKDNERASADLARTRLGELGLAAETCARVGQLVEATAHLSGDARLATAADGDLARFVDIDLAILAAPADDYDRYAAAIRREYAHVGEADWRRGRARVLQSFLDRERIYACADHHGAWEGAARANVAREAGQLESAA